MPSKAAPGEVVTIKALINHEMQSGQQKDAYGNRIPRQIIHTFNCAFNGRLVFSCDIHPAISNNPFFEFTVKVSESGTFSFEWKDDNGKTYVKESNIIVS